jgi:hypothetical protein
MFVIHNPCGIAKRAAVVLLHSCDICSFAIQAPSVFLLQVF